MSGFTIQTKVHFRSGARSKKELRTGEQRAPMPVGSTPRISRLMALAIHIDGLVKNQVVPDYATAARLGHVTRARMSQITNLLNLAPQIQESILFLPVLESGHDFITERDIRPVAAILDWRKQRKLWKAIRSRALSTTAD
jgi:hypothetical protein